MKETLRYMYAVFPVHRTTEKRRPIGTIARMYTSMVTPSTGATYPLRTRQKASTEQKNMCHMVRVTG